MQLKDVIHSPCGLRYMVDTLDLQSGISRRLLLSGEFMTNRKVIELSYAKISAFSKAFIDNRSRCRLQSKLLGLKDISSVIDRLASGTVLGDVEFFEIKELCLRSAQVSKVLADYHVGEIVIPDLSAALELLDPDGLGVPSFHVYDSYSAELKQLRIAIKMNGPDADRLLLESLGIEEKIRSDLSKALSVFAPSLKQALYALAETEILLAKSSQMQKMGLSFPTVSHDGTTSYSGMFHPEVMSLLENEGKTFQPIDISFGGRPLTLIGANMGGKTVVLRMLALCQYLFQFGFGVPAAHACIDIKEGVRLNIAGDESYMRGLSAFGAEVVKINEAIRSVREGRHELLLFDEPARTTNPEEGTALVSSLLTILDGKGADVIITTHYTLRDKVSRRLRVKGLIDGTMDYRLVEAESAGIPHEALNIAAGLGADPQWLEMTDRFIEEKKN